MDGSVLLERAQQGDRDAYGQLVEPHRGELHAHCYRMLGSNVDAEDALQEALLRAWKGLGGFEGRSSLRTWLYRITTNVCLKAANRPRILPIDFGPPSDPHDPLDVPLEESVWIGPYPTVEEQYEDHESVELAFVAVLQHLPPAQRAVLVLRDVLGFSGDETAQLLGTSADAVYSSLQRAHRTVDAKIVGPSQRTTLEDLGDARVADLARHYVDAWEGGDIKRLIAMLTDDTVLSMPPHRMWLQGRAEVAAFLAARPLADTVRWKVIPTRANGQLAFGHYMRDHDTGEFLAHSLTVVSLRGDRISHLTAFLDAEVVRSLGLPKAV